jgi:predicted anti-sigma-YlaC factor YlaD
MNQNLHCHNLFETLSAYVDGDLHDELCGEIENHLGECYNCRIVVDTLRKTIYLYRETNELVDLPEDIQHRLFQRLNLEDFLPK